MRLVAGAVVLALASSSVWAAKLYRFNVDGQLIIKDHVPAEYAQMAYEVLNEQGYVLKKVKAAPTAEELARIRAEQARKEARLERIRVQREKDMALLRLYSSPADVERARQRKSDDIDGYISLQQRRIVDMTEKLEKAQSRAANQERSGLDIPVELRLEIAQLQSQIKETHDNIKTRKADKVSSIQAYAQEYARMEILMKYPPGTLESELPASAFSSSDGEEEVEGQ